MRKKIKTYEIGRQNKIESKIWSKLKPVTSANK